MDAEHANSHDFLSVKICVIRVIRVQKIRIEEAQTSGGGVGGVKIQVFNITVGVVNSASRVEAMK